MSIDVDSLLEDDDVGVRDLVVGGGEGAEERSPADDAGADRRGDDEDWTGGHGQDGHQGLSQLHGDGVCLNSTATIWEGSLFLIVGEGGRRREEESEAGKMGVFK